MIRAVVFDWGDTVMKVFPEYSGPMAHWPRVEAIPGIRPSLDSLKPLYKMVLVSNAVDSGAKLVFDALERVGLDRYFNKVFTAKELGARKPDRAFFDSLLREIDCDPTEVVMVGDDYGADVEGAKKAGLWAVWFNPEDDRPPRNSQVKPDATIRRLIELDGIVSMLTSRVDLTKARKS